MATLTDDELLLDAIRATPDDDTPRLVYADWLDENHDEPCGRCCGAGGKVACRCLGSGRTQWRTPLAEFIRVQVEIGRFDANYCLSFDNHKTCSNSAVPLIKRSAELLHAAWSGWFMQTGTMRFRTEVNSWWFRRGFLERLPMETRIGDFYGQDGKAGIAAELFEHPISRVTLDRRPSFSDRKPNTVFWEPGFRFYSLRQIPFEFGDLAGWKVWFYGGLMVYEVGSWKRAVDELETVAAVKYGQQEFQRVRNEVR